MAVVRKQILLETTQNERLQKLRAATGRSESDIVRQAIDAYDPEEGAGNDEVRELLQTLTAQNAKTAAALTRAEAEIAATERFLAELRAERTRPRHAAKRVKRRPARAKAKAKARR